jgi:hypothetical protein
MKLQREGPDGTPDGARSLAFAARTSGPIAGMQMTMRNIEPGSGM